MGYDLEANTKKHFNNWANKYDHSILQKIFFEPIHITIIEKIAELGTEKLKILDVSCGSGNLLYKLSNIWPGGTYTGIDSSEEMIAVANKKKGNASNIRFSVASAFNLPFNDNLFDYVTNVSAFHHYTKPQEAVNEIYRVITHEGVALVADTIYNFHLGKGAIRAYNRIEMRAFFNNAGFRNIEQIRGGKLFSAPGFLTRITIGKK